MEAHQIPSSLGFSRQEHWSGLPFPSPVHESDKWKGSRSVVSNSSWPHGLQPTRLLHPWDFPGKSTGVGCHCLLHTQSTNVLQKQAQNILKREESCLQMDFRLTTATITVLIVSRVPSCSTDFKLASLHNHVNQFLKSYLYIYLSLYQCLFICQTGFSKETKMMEYTRKYKRLIRFWLQYHNSTTV